jgi:hypothetical protein
MPNRDAAEYTHGVAISAKFPHALKRLRALYAGFFIDASQGHGTAGASQHCRLWPHQSEVTVVANYYVPENRPHDTRAALVNFLARVRGRA